VTAGRVEPSDICIAESAFRSLDNHSRRLPLPGTSDKFVGEFIRGHRESVVLATTFRQRYARQRSQFGRAITARA
jgi:hypothetical protein